MSDTPRQTDPAGSAARLRADLAALAAGDAAALLVGGEGRRVIWATGAGAALAGAASPAGLAETDLDPARLPVARFAALAAGAAPLEGQRLERLRVQAGRRVETVTFACRRILLPGREPLLLLVAAGPRRPVRGPAQPVALPSLLEDPVAPGLAAGALPTVESLRAAAGGRPLLRFVWQTDAEGRFATAVPALGAVVGEAYAIRPGETWTELFARGVVDSGLAGAALDAGTTFTNVEVVWPVADGSLAVPVALSGVPDATRGGITRGMRGFGLVRLDGLAPVEAPQPGPADEGETGSVDDSAEVARLQAEPPSGAPTDAAELDDEPGSAVADGNPRAPGATAPVGDEVVWREPAPPADAPPEAPRAPAQDAPGRPDGSVIPFAQVRGLARATLADPKVVPLRAGGGAPTRVDQTAESRSSLSRSERNAFREIARALGARIEGDEEEPGEPEAKPAPAAAEQPVQPSAGPLAGPPVEPAVEPPADHPAPVAEAAQPDEPEAAPSPVEPAGDAVPATAPAVTPAAEAGVDVATPVEAAPVEAEPLSDLARHAEMVFDRLPVGIMVSRGDVPIHMNRTLLDLIGWETADDFHREGGMVRLFRGRNTQALLGPEGGTVALTTREGDIIGVDARLQTVLWDDLPATLMTFRRAVDVEFGPRLKSAELDLRRREGEVRELRAMLDTATDGVIVIDEAGRIQSINRSGEALFGYDQGEVAGETFISLFAPDSHATALDYLEGLKSNGVASVLNDGREVVGRVRQGGRIPLFMTLGAISDAPERKFCAVLRDITPWKKAEADLTEAKRAAEEASAQKSDFLAKMSHEIRTPLSAIIGFAEVMMEERFGPVGNERYLEYLRDIHASGGHVISLVNDLLDLSKIEAGRFDLSFVSVDVNESVSRSVALIQPQAGAGRVVVRTALAQRLPRVVADERSMRQIVLNLLSNAVKFTDPGGQVIVSTAMTDRGEVAIRVRDTGIGMTEKEVETALEPFRQVATARRAGGTGLGLPLTKALVEANRATLTIRSAKDAGTLVEVLFPTTRVLAE